MNIRLVNRDEILDVLHLAWEVYSEDYLPIESDDKINEFRNTIKYDNFINYYDRKEVVIFGAYDMNVLKGALILNKNGFVAMTFVQKSFRNQGMAKALMNDASDFASRYLRVPALSVYSDIGHVEFYEKVGFSKVSGITGQSGISGNLMVRTLRPVMGTNGTYGEKPKVFIPILVGIGIFLLMILTFVSISRISRESMNNYYNNGEYEEEIPYGDWEDPEYDEFGENEDEYNDELSGIDAIDAYEDPDLAFEMEDEKYSENTQEANKYIDFDVVYPSLKGLPDEAVQDKINEEIRRTAMATVEELYTNPGDDVKEQILQSDVAYLVSYVKYKVTYVNNDVISIVFDDNTCKISENNIKTHLRTLTMNLKDGTIYTAKDIFDLSDDFLDTFRINMQLESGDSNFLNDLDDEELKKALEGKDATKEYVPQFFIHANGMEIGFDITPNEKSVVEHIYSWITAPFSKEEINTYKSNSDLWKLIGNFDN